MDLRSMVPVALSVSAVIYITGVALWLFTTIFPLLGAAMVVLSGFAMMAVSFGLYHSYKKLEKNHEKQMDVLTEGLTHDFNNLLSPVESYATFLCEDLPPESESYGFADKIIEALPQMRRVLDRIRKNPNCYEKENEEAGDR